MKTLAESIDAIHAVIPREQIAALYQVGITDNSLLSDIDIVIVTQTPRPAVSIPGVDVRGVFSISEFAGLRDILPYRALSLISGTDVPAAPSDLSSEDRDLIRLAGMFYTSFLRNFYRDKTRGVKQTLIDLNDFAYAISWLPQGADILAEYWARVVAARETYPAIDQAAVDKLLEDGIKHAWKLVEILDGKISARFGISAFNRRFFGKEPTVFLDSALECKMWADRNHGIVRATKALALPRSFANLAFADTPYFAVYRRLRLMPERSSIARVKHALKCAGLLLSR